MRSDERKGKAEIRWDSEGNSAYWRDKQIAFEEHHYSQLSEICEDPGFSEAVNGVASHYLSKSKPASPENARWKPEYRKRWVPPTLGDMKVTLHDLEEAENKIRILAATRRTHPIWKLFKDAWYAETKSMLDDDCFDMLRCLDDKFRELETTPDDHSAKPLLVEVWANQHEANFNALNNKIIPVLVKHALAHINDVYPEKRTKSSENERWLAWRLALVIKRFGIKPTGVKDGALCRCLEIVLEAAGRPYASVHNYISSEMLEQVKSRNE